MLVSVNAKGVMINMNSRKQDKGQVLIPMYNILDYFPKQPFQKDIYIIVYLDIQKSQ